MLLSKTQNLTEGGRVNSVVSAICHPVNLIRGLIIEVGGVTTKNLGLYDKSKLSCKVQKLS
jgi:hypothetical protein